MGAAVAAGVLTTGADVVGLTCGAADGLDDGVVATGGAPQAVKAVPIAAATIPCSSLRRWRFMDGFLLFHVLLR
jgi:hypothetical protein